MEVKIEIPDNCELIKEGDSYIVQERPSKPRSWEEFCNKFPVTSTEHYIDDYSDIINTSGWTHSTRTSVDKNLCVSKEEAGAFLSLMQLRQLRKAWIEDWEQPNNSFATAAILYSVNKQKVIVDYGNYWTLNVLSFPTKRMAEEFFECFKDLCETAKILL